MWQIGSINVAPLFVSKINFSPPGRKNHPSEECHLCFSLSAVRSEGSYIIGIPPYVVKQEFKLFFEFLFNFISDIYKPNAAAAQEETSVSSGTLYFRRPATLSGPPLSRSPDRRRLLPGTLFALASAGAFLFP
jgi:hypothetical protein